MPADLPAPLRSKDRWFSQLPEDAAQRLLGIAQTRHADAARFIVRRGQRHTGLFGLVEGVVHVLNQFRTEKESLLAASEPPMWFGETGFFDGSPFSHDVQAHTACTLLVFPREPVLGLLDEMPVLWKHLGRLQSLNLRAAFFLIDEFSAMDTGMRLARRLLASGAGFGLRRGFSATLSLRQELLAHSLGLARASVAPILRDWRRRGIVELAYGRITLADIDELKSIAGFADWPESYKRMLDAPVRSGPLDLAQ